LGLLYIDFVMPNTGKSGLTENEMLFSETWAGCIDE